MRRFVSHVKTAHMPVRLSVIYSPSPPLTSREVAYVFWDILIRGFRDGDAAGRPSRR